MENIKIGAEFGYNSSRSNYAACFLHINKVAKVTKTGTVTLENGMKFNKYGIEIVSKVSSFPHSSMVDCDSIRRTWARKEETDKINKLVQRAKDLLNVNQTYTAAQLDAIKALNAILEP